MAARVPAGVTAEDDADGVTVAADVPATEAAGWAAGAAPAAGAIAGGLFEAILVVDGVAAEPVLGRKVPTSQFSECGLKVTLSPFMPLTRRPFTVVEPVPRRVLSGSTESATGVAELSMWTISRSAAFSTL